MNAVGRVYNITSDHSFPDNPGKGNFSPLQVVSERRIIFLGEKQDLALTKPFNRSDLSRDQGIRSHASKLSYQRCDKNYYAAGSSPSPLPGPRHSPVPSQPLSRRKSTSRLEDNSSRSTNTFQPFQLDLPRQAPNHQRVQFPTF